jgi:hypothetical protein
MSITKNTETLKLEVQQHIAADAVIHGIYWNNDNYSGCFMGRRIHPDNLCTDLERFGLTECLMCIADAIFSKLPKEEARQFFADFLDAIAIDGKDLSLVHWKFLAETLRGLPPQVAKIQSIIDPVIKGMDLLASGGVWAASYSYATNHLADSAAYDAQVAHDDAGADAAWAAAAAAACPEGQYGKFIVHWSQHPCYTIGGYACDAHDDAGAEICRQRDSLLKIIQESPIRTSDCLHF